MVQYGGLQNSGAVQVWQLRPDPSPFAEFHERRLGAVQELSTGRKQEPSVSLGDVQHLEPHQPEQAEHTSGCRSGQRRPNHEPATHHGDATDATGTKAPVLTRDEAMRDADFAAFTQHTAPKKTNPFNLEGLDRSLSYQNN